MFTGRGISWKYLKNLKFKVKSASTVCYCPALAILRCSKSMDAKNKRNGHEEIKNVSEHVVSEIVQSLL